MQSRFSKDTTVFVFVCARGFVVSPVFACFVGHTLHMCLDVCVWVTIWHSEVVCAVCENRRVRHATHPLLPLGSSTQLDFVPPVPSRLCACLVATDHPPVLGCLCLWAAVAATGLPQWVVLVACTPLVGWSLWWLCPCYQWIGCSWRALPVLPMNQAVFPNVALRLP